MATGVSFFRQIAERWLGLDGRFQLGILGVVCALLWRVELEVSGWDGLAWVRWFHFAIPVGLVACLVWMWLELDEISNRRKVPLFGFLGFFGIGILMILDFLLKNSFGYNYWGGVPYFVLCGALLIILWISIPISTFAIFRMFVRIEKREAIIGCVIFWLSWAVALLFLAILPGPSSTDLIHTLKSGLIIPPIIVGLGWPLVMRERDV